MKSALLSAIKAFANQTKINYSQFITKQYEKMNKKEEKPAKK